MCVNKCGRSFWLLLKSAAASSPHCVKLLQGMCISTRCLACLFSLIGKVSRKRDFADTASKIRGVCSCDSFSQFLRQFKPLSSTHLASCIGLTAVAGYMQGLAQWSSGLCQIAACLCPQPRRLYCVCCVITHKPVHIAHRVLHSIICSARQAQQAQLGTHCSNQLSPTPSDLC